MQTLKQDQLQFIGGFSTPARERKHQDSSNNGKAFIAL